MKILVFDDSIVHRRAAEILLGKDHELTVVSSYDEAVEALSMDIDHDFFRVLKMQAGLGDYPRQGTDEDKAVWRAAEDKLMERALKHPDFDMVLTDLLVPASRKAQGPKGEQFVGREMPLGTIVALRALAAGVRLVAVVTDMNHHDHPASAAFDRFQPFTVGEAKVFCTNHVGRILIDENTGEAIDDDFFDSLEGKVKYPFIGDQWGPRKGIVFGKDWKAIVNRLVGKTD